MNSAKDEVRLLLNELPDDCSIEDIQYHLYVIEKVRHGLGAADKRGAVPHEEAEKRLRKWITDQAKPSPSPRLSTENACSAR